MSARDERWCFKPAREREGRGNRKESMEGKIEIWSCLGGQNTTGSLTPHLFITHVRALQTQTPSFYLNGTLSVSERAHTHTHTHRRTHPYLLYLSRNQSHTILLYGIILTYSRVLCRVFLRSAYSIGLDSAIFYWSLP